MGYLSETHLKLKSCENSFINNTSVNNPVILKFCSIKQLLKWNRCYGQTNFTRFEFKMSFGLMPHIAQHPWFLHWNVIEVWGIVSLCAIFGKSQCIVNSFHHQIMSSLVLTMNNIRHLPYQALLWRINRLVLLKGRISTACGSLILKNDWKCNYNFVS